MDDTLQGPGSSGATASAGEIELMRRMVHDRLTVRDTSSMG